MSNDLSTIAYAVEIRTGTSLNSPNVGLYEGTFRFVTNNYDMNNAVDEDSNPIENPDFWYTEFIDTDGIGKVGSQIDITVGGDQSYLSSASVKLVNYTTLGYRYHDALKDITGLYPTSSEMIIYCIINDVRYTRWVGKVSNNYFTDDTYTWVGSDLSNDDNDTLSNELVGYVNGTPAVYEGTPESIWNDLLLSSFGFSDFAKTGIKHDYQTDNLFDNPGGFAGWTGLSYAGLWSTYYLPLGSSRTISIEKGQFWFDNISVNDYVTFGDKLDDIYVIREIDGGTLKLDSLPSGLTSYNSMFQTSPDSHYSTTIYDALSTPSGAEYINIWKHRDLNINADNLESSTQMTIVQDNGENIIVDYSLDDNGKVLMGRQVTTDIIPPSSVSYFNSDIELFTDGKYKTDNGDWFDDIQRTNILLSNDLNADSTFQRMDSATYHYFEIVFDKPDIDLSEYNLSFMLKGIYDEDTENWQEVDLGAGHAFWDTCTQGNYDDGHAPTYGHMTVANNAEEFTSINPEEYQIKVFNMKQTTSWGSIPSQIPDNTTYLAFPNIRDVGRWSNYYYDTPNDRRHCVSGQVSNLVATNIPYYDNKVMSTYDNTLAKLNGSGVALNPQLAIVDGVYPNSGTEWKVESGTKYLVQISGNMTAGKTVYFKDIAGNETVDSIGGDDVVTDCPFLLNGFALASVDKAFDNGGSFNYVSNNEETNTYPKVAKWLTGTQDTIINRDTWVTGRYLEEPIPRHDLVTSLMKQGFVAGWINRFGNQTFKTFLEDYSGPSHYFDNNIILTNSLKTFALTSIDKVYNEFNIKWNYSPVLDKYQNEVIIKNVKEDFFPASTGNWTEFVSGVPNYENAKDYWNECHIAYLVSKTINKAPEDRTELEWAVDDSENKPLTLGSGTDDIDLVADIASGDLHVGGIAYFEWGTIILEGQRVTLRNIDLDESYAVVNVLDIVTESGQPRKYSCEIIEWQGLSGVVALTCDSKDSTTLIDVNDWISRGEYSTEVYSFGKVVSADTVIDFGLDITTQYFDKTANVGDIIEMNVDYQLPSTAHKNLRFIVQVNSIVSTPLPSPIAPQGTFTGTIIEVGEFFDDFRPTTATYNPRFSTFIYKLGINDLEGYPWEYLNELVKWTTYQKYQVNLQLAITADTIKYELVDNITLSDPVITPFGQVGNGWITKYFMNPKKNIIEVQVTFEPEFLVQPSIPTCDEIIEDQYNPDEIVEDENNIDDIVEAYCPYGN